MPRRRWLVLFVGLILSGLLLLSLNAPAILPRPQSSPVALTPNTDFRTLEQIVDSGILRVGTSITSPFQYYDSRGVLVGFNVDLMNALARRLGVELVWQEFIFADLVDALENHRVDVVIAALYVSPERQRQVAMSQGYVETGLVALVHLDAPPLPPLPQGLTAKRIGVKEGGASFAYAQDLREDKGLSFELRIYSESQAALVDLQARRLDVVLNDRLNSLLLIREGAELRVEGGVLVPAELGIAVHLQNHDLLSVINQTLDEFEADGTLSALTDQWISPQVTLDD